MRRTGDRLSPPLARLFCFVLVACTASAATAQTVRVRTHTVGRGTQLRRADLTRDAERSFSQSLSLWAWDALPAAPGSLDVHASARYVDDFGVAAEDRDNPFVESARSRFIIDLAHLRYRPVDAVTLTAGRLWAPSALGMRDVDGARLRLSMPLRQEVRSWVDVHAGREVASGWATVNADAWDVQGLPVYADGSAPGGLRAGFDAGLSVGEAHLSLAWQRRTEAGAIGDERIGTALRGNVHPRLALSASAAYHTLLQAVDRADLQLAWREPLADTVLSAGLEHRLPWFDAASIFNVFGARPFEGAYATWQLPVAAWRTSFTLRSWARAYDANLDLADLGAGEGDARAYGAGVGHDTRFRAFGRDWTWRSFGSAQSSTDRAQGGTQWLGDTALRVPVLRDALAIEGRFVGVRVAPAPLSVFGSGGAFTTVFGVEVPATFGALRLQVEGQSSSWYGGNLNAYASFTSELWL